MDNSDDRKKSWLKKLTTLFLGQGAFIFMVFAVILGSLGDNLVERYNDHPDAYLISVLIVGGAYLIIAIITVIVTISIFSKDRNLEIAKAISEQPEICRNIRIQLTAIQQAANHFQSVLIKDELAKSVISGSEIDDLEASVGKDKKIIIFTSKFVLEGSIEFTKVIIRNFRKGVKYEYYVPNEERPTLYSYWEMAKEWYREFAVFMQSRQKAEELLSLSKEDTTNGNSWNDEYIEQINQYIAGLSKNNQSQDAETVNAIKQKLKEMFTSQLVSYALDTKLFYVTTAMYEKGINDWRAIIKLPTENPKENYVAFSLDNVGDSEKEEFKKNIFSLAKGNTQLTIPETVFS